MRRTVSSLTPSLPTTGAGLSTMPTSTSGRAARMAAIARPWASSRWWATTMADRGCRSPGAWMPEA